MRLAIFRRYRKSSGPIKPLGTTLLTVKHWCSMRSRFPGFATVRIACSLCGWFRILGPVGSNGVTRALIRLRSDPAECNVVHSDVMEMAVDDVAKQGAATSAGYRDLAQEW